MVRELLRRAQEFVLLSMFSLKTFLLSFLSYRGGQAPEDAPRPTAFFGGGHTLGSDDTPSSFIPDPNATSTDLGTSSAIAPSTYLLYCDNRPGSRPALDLLEERLSS